MYMLNSVGDSKLTGLLISPSAAVVVQLNIESST